jgi:hypothetical protein
LYIEYKSISLDLGSFTGVFSSCHSIFNELAREKYTCEPMVEDEEQEKKLHLQLIGSGVSSFP